MPELVTLLDGSVLWFSNPICCESRSQNWTSSNVVVLDNAPMFCLLWSVNTAAMKMFFLNLLLITWSMSYLQVWGVKYNGSGSKIVSVGDDQEIHIYDCPV